MRTRTSRTLRTLIAATIPALLSVTLSSIALAKLPPPSPEAKAKADETKNKAAWTDKVAAYQLCLVQNKIVEHYQRTKGIQVTSTASTTTPPCQDPGAYVSLIDQTKTAGK